MSGVEASGTSGGDHQSLEANNLMRDLTGSIKMKLKSLDDALIKKTAADEQSNKPKIPRVPKKLRDKVDWNFFEPMVVSIGPYHLRAGFFSSSWMDEGMKIKLAAMFVKEHEVNKENLYCKIKMAIEDLRNCYEVDAIRGNNKDDLAWRFLIDGCVVLHFIYVINYGYNIQSRKYEGLEILLAFTDRFKIQRDIMLLENQLPYQLLQLIISSSKESDRQKLEKSIRDFIISMTWDDQPEENQVPEENQENALHLLDLLWKTVTCVRANKKSSVMEWIIGWSFKIIGKPVDIVMNFIILNFLDKILRLRGTFNLRNLRNIQDLKAAGVGLKLNTTGSLTDVEFSHGTLHLPAIVVNNETAFKFLNLMAHEISRSNTLHKYEICSYIVFLASLIDRPEDVKELRVEGILQNHLDSDEEVVKLFKLMRIDYFEVDFVYKYDEILDKIRKHYNTRRHRVWMAQLKTRYFESPSSVIALFGAIMILVLTFLQIYYSILSYYKEKK